MMNKLRIGVLLLMLAPVASMGILGCGGHTPQPQQEGFDAAAVEAEIEEAEQRTPALEPGVPPPEGESTVPDEGP